MDFAPRGPIVREKSGTLDFTDNYIRKLKSFRLGSREQALRELRSNKEWARLAEYIKCLEGDMWPKNRPRFRSSFVDNHLSRARKETLAQYTDVRPMISVRGPQDFSKTADILTKMCIHEWTAHDMDLSLSQCLDHALLSVGYLKVNGALGRISLIACGMDTVMPINNNGNLQESSAIRYSAFKPISYFYTRFGRDLAEKLVKRGTIAYRGQQPASTYTPSVGMSEYSWNRLSPSMKYVMRDRVPDETRNADNRDTFPVSELEELWWEDLSVNELSHPVIVKDPNRPTSTHNYWYEVKPGERLYPRKRLMVGAGEEIVYDGPSPYWTDEYPFAELVLDPVVWAPGGLSKYRSLMPLNKGMNEISTGVFDTVKKAINQAYVAKRGSVAQADWDRFFPEIPGQRMLLNNTADVRDVRALDPPNLPTYVFEFAKYLLSNFDRHAGSMDMASLSKKKQVPGGDTLEQIRDSQSAPIRLEGRYIEAFLRRMGKIAVSHIIQFFPKKERYYILGNDGVTWEDYEWDPTNMVPASHAKETFWKLFPVTISPGSLHGANRDRDQTKALVLFKSGALSLETLLQKADIGDVNKELERIASDRKNGISPGATSGRTPRQSRGQRNAQIA